MLITILGGAIVLVVATFVSWPWLVASAPTGTSAGQSLQDREEVLVLEKQRDNALSGLRDAEMDHATGRLSEADYAAMRSELETEAMAAIQELDLIGGATAETAGFCPSCGAPRGPKDSFCGQCGASLASVRA